MDYDHKEKVHRLYIHFKIPVVTQDGEKTGNSGNGDKYLIYQPLKLTDNQNGQLNPVENYSTVVGSSRSVSLYKPLSSTTSYSFKLTVELVSSNLWTSPYTPYQQEVYDLTRKLHEDDGWNFKQISDWFNENNYLTPRGKVFHKNHVWSIYTKKNRSIDRFSREYDHKITDMKVDVVDYKPKSE